MILSFMKFGNQTKCPACGGNIVPIGYFDDGDTIMYFGCETCDAGKPSGKEIEAERIRQWEEFVEFGKISARNLRAARKVKSFASEK